mgnify:CR=1 FL=1
MRDFKLESHAITISDAELVDGWITQQLYWHGDDLYENFGLIDDFKIYETPKAEVDLSGMESNTATLKSLQNSLFWISNY